MLRAFTSNLRRFHRRLGWSVRRRAKPRIVVKKLAKSYSRTQIDHRNSYNSSAVIHRSNELRAKPIRIATFNASFFAMAQAVPECGISSNGFQSLVRNSKNHELDRGAIGARSTIDRPKSILKHSPLHPNHFNSSKSRLRVSINLPENEISLSRSGRLIFKSPPSSPRESNRTIFEVLRDLDADLLALQDVKAEEENNMKPLSDLAAALGMTFVFAESWAPQFGNAILSKWPIKKWKAHKISDSSDFRNVLKATIEVPESGEINIMCTLLDHLDEKLRLEQLSAIIRSTPDPHILAGVLNALDQTDYSHQRWRDIYYEEMGKPTPRSEVMEQLKKLGYTDARHFAGECEPVVMITKGQSVQGTCKYGTRVDYVLSSPASPYEFVPGSYSVVSSRGTSDHHVVKVDVMKVPAVACARGRTEPEL